MSFRRLLAALTRRLPGEWGVHGRPAPPLVRCPACGSDHMCVMDTEETDETHWWIRLRCGACEVWRDVVATDEEAADLDRDLTAQTTAIERALAALDRERMSVEVDLLIAALQRDLIDPSSFAT